MPPISKSDERKTRDLHALLLNIYRKQHKISHRDAAKDAGTDPKTASQYYHHGVVTFALPAIKSIIIDDAARARADRARAERKGFMMMESFRLEDAQEDARAVMLLEGQMISALRRGASAAVAVTYGMWEAVKDMIPQLIQDVRDVASGDVESTPRQRRALFNEVMKYHRGVMELVERVMELERAYLNEPLSVVGTQLDTDIEDLTRQALESAAALKQTAMLIDVTPETTH